MPSRDLFTEFVARNDLPASFEKRNFQHYIRIAEWVAELVSSESGATPVLGISGAQGTGKSTLTEFLQIYLKQNYDVSAAAFSIDDVYLTREERLSLSKKVHPLLATRGVPGTHDLRLATDTLDALCNLEAFDSVLIPRFDKSIDDRCAKANWQSIQGPIDIVIFEGWCIGAKSVCREKLLTPINDLELYEDPDGRWRSYVNAQLNSYERFFEKLTATVFLKAPNFVSVYKWREKQEKKLRLTSCDSENEIMTEEGVKRFVQHFERVTLQNMAFMSKTANVIVKLGTDHTVNSVVIHSH